MGLQGAIHGAVNGTREVMPCDIVMMWIDWIQNIRALTILNREA